MFGRLVVADLKMIVRNRQSLFWAIAFPIMFTMIFGLFDFESIDEATAAVLPERAPASAPIVAGLRQAGIVELEQGFASPEAARAAVRDGELDFALLVGEQGDVEILFMESAADKNRFFLPVFRQVLNELNLRLARVDPTYRAQPVGLEGHAVSYYDFVLPGIVGMAVMSYGIIGLGSTVAQYRGQRILRRILATPLRPRTFLGAIVVAHLVLALVQSAIVLTLGVFAFGGVVRGNLLSIAVLVVLGNLTFLNLGFVVASRAETAEAASGFGNALTMPMMFFSGVFFPTSSLPWILPTLTAILPLSPMVYAIRAVALDGASITELGWQIVQLIAWAAATFVLAARVFRFERA